MNLNKFYYFLVVLLCSISFTACSDDDDKQTVPHIELTASMSAFSEGILSFDEENGILSISKEGTLTSSITLGDAAGADMDGIALKATVPAADKMWCLATCSKNRLSLICSQKQCRKCTPDHNRNIRTFWRPSAGYLHAYHHPERCRERGRTCCCRHHSLYHSRTNIF